MTEITELEARTFAKEWIEGWNSHNLDTILSHYAVEVVLISPVAARLFGNPRVVGQKSLKAYFAKGLEFYPDLSFTLLEVMWGISTVVLYYLNQSGRKCAEFMELAPDGKVIKVIAHYGS